MIFIHINRSIDKNIDYNGSINTIVKMHLWCIACFNRGVQDPFMCGIIGCLSNGDAAATGMSGLRRLEYRGYDSAGIAVIDRGRLSVVKERGRIDELENKHKISQMRGSIAILHTRWATHGAPSSVNAHPHTDCKGKLALVHNVIIENHSLLRKILEGEGHCFRSETDSEVIAHLIEKFRAGCSLRDAVRKATALLEGAYAICVVDEGE